MHSSAWEGLPGPWALPKALISQALPIFLEQCFSQIIIDTLWGRLAGSQVDGSGNAEKELGSGTESGFAHDMINERDLVPKTRAGGEETVQES